MPRVGLSLLCSNFYLVCFWALLKKSSIVLIISTDYAQKIVIQHGMMSWTHAHDNVAVSAYCIGA